MNIVLSLRRFYPLTFTVLALGAYAQTPGLAIRENGALVDIVFTGTHTLERADTIRGQWITLGNQTDVYTDPDSAVVNQRFYRIHDGAVFSSNAVGYYRLGMPSGFSMIANQLTTFSDTVTNLFKSPPENTTLFKFKPATQGFTIVFYTEGDWQGGHPELTLGPGEGAFLATQTAFSQRFLGEVPMSRSVAIPQGWNLLSNPLPESGPLNLAPPTGLGFPIAEGDTIFRWNGVGYSIQTFSEGAWTGDSTQPPVVRIGECFFFLRAGPATTWNRTYTVGP
ncbi:MAG TPA: hypothetical protein VK615_05140 [Candidatus Binatia bacterium]|nr:hypothetical protein [Candidatus Binatia bacterium]